MLVVWLGCWQPESYTPPPAAQVEASDVLEGTAGEIQPPSAAEATPDGEGAADEAPAAADPAAEAAGDEADASADGEAADEVEEPAPPVAVAVAPWKGRTVGRPLTLVGDDGTPLQVVEQGVAVTVLMEGEDRVKLRCDGCLPVVEGWLQKRNVLR